MMRRRWVSSENFTSSTSLSLPLRSTYTWCGPFTITSVMDSSRRSWSMGPYPRTSSVTDCTSTWRSATVSASRSWPRARSSCSSTWRRSSTSDTRWSVSSGPSSWITNWCIFWRISSSWCSRWFNPCAARCSCQRGAGCWVWVTTYPPRSLAPPPLLGRGARAEQRLGNALDRPRHGRLRLVDHHGAAGVHRHRHRDVVGYREVGAEPEHPLDLLHVELHLRVRVVEHELELRARDRLEVQRLHPDLQVLDAGDVHAADEEDLVGSFEQREHVVVERGRQVHDDVTGDRLERGADVDHLARHERIGGHGLQRGGQHEHARRRVLGRQRLHQLHVAVLHGRSGVEHGVLWREAEHDRHVAELEVAVDQDDRLGGALRHRRGDVDRDARLADATLGGEHRDEPPGRARAGRRCLDPGRGAAEQLADPVDRLVE